MANESLNKSTLVVDLNIPQTAQELLLNSCAVQNWEVSQTAQENLTTTSFIQYIDIPQSIQESEAVISAVKFLEIASTLDENFLLLTAVVGQNDSIRKNILTSDKISLDNQIKSSEIWVEHGIPHVIIQKNVDNNQNVT